VLTALTVSGLHRLALATKARGEGREINVERRPMLTSRVQQLLFLKGGESVSGQLKADQIRETL
jgi:hypothetical protein